MSWVDSKIIIISYRHCHWLHGTLPADIVCWGGGEGSYTDSYTKDSVTAAKTEAKIHQVLRAKVWTSVSSD